MSKYLWVSEEFDIWMKEQVKEINEAGFVGIGTRGLTKILVDKVLKHNDIQMARIIVPYAIKKKNGITEVAANES